MSEPVVRSPQGQVMLTGLRDAELSVDEVVGAVRHARAGGIATFIGVVREQDHGHRVDALDYSCHPSAPDVLADVAAQVAARHPQVRLAAVHRTGHLVVGDLAVVVAAGSAHRDEAFRACRDLIDSLKATVPIWKHQLFTDGSDEWVGSP